MTQATRSRKNTFQIFASRWTDPAWLQRRLDCEECEFVAATLRDYRRRLRSADPATVMRLEGIVTLYILARRAGLTALSVGLPSISDDRREAERKPADGDGVGKAQERLRKALKEFEDAIGRTPDAGAAGLADLLRPLLKETEGIVEESAASGNGHLEGSHDREDNPRHAVIADSQR